MSESIFLSASVPDPKRSPEHARTADSVAITAAVSALVHVTWGRRVLVWGGHPAITPMIRAVADSMGRDYRGWAGLYQSGYFAGDYPDDNDGFKDVVYVDAVNGDQAQSLRRMRERMFREQAFAGAVFIGGTGGIVEEFELFRECQPDAVVLPVLSTGGATLALAPRLPAPNPDLLRDLKENLDYVALFHRHLAISVQEERYASPEDQPARVEERLWRPRGSAT